jgi:hypothetical protein
MSPLTRLASPRQWAIRLGAVALFALPAGSSQAAAPAAAPAAQPARPVHPAPVKPAAQAAKPVAQPAKPAAQPAKPVVQPAAPAAQPAKPAAQPAKATPPPRPAVVLVRCEKAAARFAASDRFNPAAAARELSRIARLEPNCTKAPEAAYGALEAVWDKLLPDARGRVPASVVRGELARYARHVSLLDALMAFRRSPRRTFAALKLGELNEAMASYLDQVGSAPNTLMVTRVQPESLYHTRAVDINENMRLEAEAAYQKVMDLTADSPQPNKLRDQARERLDALAGRYSERREQERAAQERARAKEDERRALESQL